MEFEDLEQALLENLRSLWRIKFALLAQRTASQSQSMLVNYENLPKNGPSNLFPRSESVLDAMKNLDAFSHAPLATNLLLANMAQYEAFLKHHVVVTKKGGPPGLGTLQKIAESSSERPISDDTKISINEIRERRNIVVHRAGIADERYIQSAAAAQPLSNGSVGVVAPGSRVEITPAYFHYATNVLIVYCRQVAGL